MSLQIFLTDDGSSDLFQDIAGWVGNVLALFFFFSPAIGMYELIKRKREFSTIPYLSLIANTMNCLLWCVYGLKKEEPIIYVCNSIGGVTNIIYLVIFWYFFVGEKVVKYLGMLAATFLSLGAIFSLCYFLGDIFSGLEKSTEIDIIGYAAMVFNIIMYAAPGQKLVKYIFNHRIYFLVRSYQNWRL